MSSGQRCLGHLLLKQTGDTEDPSGEANVADEVDASEASLLLVHYESISLVLVKRGSWHCPWRLEGALSHCLRLEGWWLPLSLRFLLIQVHTMGGLLVEGWQWLSLGFPGSGRAKSHTWLGLTPKSFPLQPLQTFKCLGKVIATV